MFWSRPTLRLVQLLALSALSVASHATSTQSASWSVDLALFGNNLTYSYAEMLGWIAANENLQHRFGPFSVHLASGPACTAVADQECHTIHAHFTKSPMQMHQQDDMLDVHTSTRIMRLFCRWIEQCITIELFERLDRPFLVSCQPTKMAPYPSPPSEQNDWASGRRLSDSCPRNLSPSARLACCLTPHSAADVRNLTAIRTNPDDETGADRVATVAGAAVGAAVVLLLSIGGCFLLARRLRKLRAQRRTKRISSTQLSHVARKNPMMIREFELQMTRRDTVHSGRRLSRRNTTRMLHAALQRSADVERKAQPSPARQRRTSRALPSGDTRRDSWQSAGRGSSGTRSIQSTAEAEELDTDSDSSDGSLPTEEELYELAPAHAEGWRRYRNKRTGGVFVQFTDTDGDFFYKREGEADVDGAEVFWYFLPDTHEAAQVDDDK